MVDISLIHLLAHDDGILAVIKKESQVCIAGDNEPRPYPKIVIDNDGGDYVLHAEGALPHKPNNVFINCWSKDAVEASALADAVEDVIVGYSDVPDEYLDGMTILVVRRFPRAQETKGIVEGRTNTLFCQTIECKVYS
jgi:hypothetical protein